MANNKITNIKIGDTTYDISVPSNSSLTVDSLYINKSLETSMSAESIIPNIYGMYTTSGLTLNNLTNNELNSTLDRGSATASIKLSYDGEIDIKNNESDIYLTAGNHLILSATNYIQFNNKNLSYTFPNSKAGTIALTSDIPHLPFTYIAYNREYTAGSSQEFTLDVDGYINILTYTDSSNTKQYILENADLRVRVTNNSSIGMAMELTLKDILYEIIYDAVYSLPNKPTINSATIIKKVNQVEIYYKSYPTSTSDCYLTLIKADSGANVSGYSKIIKLASTYKTEYYSSDAINFKYQALNTISSGALNGYFNTTTSPDLNNLIVFEILEENVEQTAIAADTIDFSLHIIIN